MERTGRVHVIPDDVDTDQIIPGEYLNTVTEAELGEHALEGYDPEFAGRIVDGDVLVAGRNFGLGSSREAAPVALKNAGVGAVLAESFARIFYRNCINVGLPIVEVPGITDHVSAGDTIRVDVGVGTVENRTTDETFSVPPLPEDLLDVLQAGGLIAYSARQDD